MAGIMFVFVFLKTTCVGGNRSCHNKWTEKEEYERKKAIQFFNGPFLFFLQMECSWFFLDLLIGYLWLLLHDSFMEVLHLLQVGDFFLISNIGIIRCQTH